MILDRDPKCYCLFVCSISFLVHRFITYKPLSVMCQAPFQASAIQPQRNQIEQPCLSAGLTCHTDGTQKLTRCRAKRTHDTNSNEEKQSSRGDTATEDRGIPAPEAVVRKRDIREPFFNQEKSKWLRQGTHARCCRVLQATPKTLSCIPEREGATKNIDKIAMQSVIQILAIV